MHVYIIVLVVETVVAVGEEPVVVHGPSKEIQPSSCFAYPF